jgi:hypothetical protein
MRSVFPFCVQVATRPYKHDVSADHFETNAIKSRLRKLVHFW